MTKKFYKNIICLMAIALSYFLFSNIFCGRGIKNVLADDPAITTLWGFSGTKSGTEITLTDYTNPGNVQDVVIPNAADFRGLGGEYTDISKVWITKDALNKAACQRRVNEKERAQRNLKVVAEVVTIKTLRVSNNGSGDLSKVFYKGSDMSDVFFGSDGKCIDLTGLDTSDVTNLNSAFRQCLCLKKLLGLETLNVSKVEDFGDCFRGCACFCSIPPIEEGEVKVLERSLLETLIKDSSDNASDEFVGDISFLQNWDVSSATTLSKMFYDDNLINFADLSKWNLKDECDVSQMFGIHDGTHDTPGTKKSYRSSDDLYANDDDQYPILVITKSKNLQDKDGTAEVYKNRKKVSKVILTLDNHEFKDGSHVKEFENTNVIYLPDDVWADLNGGEEEGKNISYELEEITNDGVYKIKASWPDMLNSDYDWPKVKTGLKYNGAAQELLDMSTLRLPDGCKLMYKFDDDVEWVEYDHENPNPPEKTKVGNYKIDLKIVGYNYKHVENSNNPIEVSIEEKEKEYGWNSINSGGGTINKTNETASNSSDKKNDTKKNESQSQEQPNNIAPKTISNLVLPEEIKTKKYVSGYDDKTFKPENKITRAEVARLIYNLIANNEKVSSESLDKFTDLEKNIWYGDAVAYLANKKIINGYENKFNPDSFITRAEMAQILFNVLKFYDSSSSLKYSYGLYEYNFIDLDTNHWANEAIKQLASNRIINGYEDKTFRPDQNITRAEAIVMISKTFKRDSSNINYDSKNKFFDLSESHWAFNYIMDAVE